jgi:hypothetical protein
MLKKVLLWLTSLGAGDVQIWIRPGDKYSYDDDRIIFLNTPLSLLNFSIFGPEQFKGLRELRNLSANLKRPISVWSNRSKNPSLIGYILPGSTNAELERFGEEILEKTNGILITQYCPDSAREIRLPKIYV